MEELVAYWNSAIHKLNEKNFDRALYSTKIKDAIKAYFKDGTV